MEPLNSAKNRLCVDVRTEGGRSQINVSLDGLTDRERQFLRGVLEVTRRGGQVNFSLNRGEEGEMLLTFSLREPARKVKNAVAQALITH